MQRYRDYNTYLRALFGERVQKIPLDAGLGCPNRDGTLSNAGCIFCNSRGSGTGAFLHQGLSIGQQVLQAMAFLERRYRAKKFIAYFQSFTNTRGPLSRLKALYDEALAHEAMVGLSVATRPDCVDRDVLSLLQSYQDRYLVWIEYGLQSAHDQTLKRVNRGHDRACFERAIHLTREYGINICAHVILGLPGENPDMMLETARFLAGLPLQGVKIHLLYVVQGTPLAALYEQGLFHCLERQTYADLVVDFLEYLPPDWIIQRLTGDPAPSEMVAPTWSLEKGTNLKCIQETLEKRRTWQGRLYKEANSWPKGHPHSTQIRISKSVIRNKSEYRMFE